MGRSLPSDWNKRRKDVFKRDKYTCANCNKNGKKSETRLNAHHIVPREAGGTHKLSNIVTLCEKCHHSVHHPNIQAPTSEKIIDYDRFVEVLYTPPEQLSDPDREFLIEVSMIIYQFAGKNDHEFYPSPNDGIFTSEMANLYNTEEKSNSKRWRDLRAEWLNEL